MSPIDPALLSRLARWNDLRDRGQTPTLEEVCADRPDLVEDLRRAIRESDEMEALLAPDDPYATRGGGLPADTVVAEPPAGGRYHLGGELAHGGMGVVYRATDTRFGREVAVKVVASRYATDAGVTARFSDEARITAQLQHPGVPPVFDYGTLPDGRPFLAMKLIKGKTLEVRLKDAAGRGALVAVFEQICQALAYAHDRGVIHRDLKPLNVMVGDFGEVQVMDWGLAKVLGAARANDPTADTIGTQIRSGRKGDDETRADSVLGTVAYMPPEQAAGAINKIDKRSDVFGLGGILCAILTGKPPFVGDTADTMRVKAAQGDVADCFGRLDACGADPELVALCKKCLSPKQEDRPATAKEVAGAVARLRAAADERARQAELDRAAAELKAAEARRRRRVWLGLAGTLAAALVVTIVLAFLINKARSEKGQALDQVTKERDEKEAALKEKEAALALARERGEIARQALTEFTENFLGLVGRQPRLTPDHEQMLKKMYELNERLLAQAGRDEQGRADAAAARVAMAHILERLGRLDEAEKASRAAEDAYAALLKDFPGNRDYRLGVAKAHGDLAFRLRDKQDHAAAERAFREALRTIEGLAADDPDNREYLRLQATAHTSIGDICLESKRLKEAWKEFEAARGFRRRLADADPTDEDAELNVAKCVGNLGLVRKAEGNLAEAARLMDQMAEVAGRLAKAHPRSIPYKIELATTRMNVGVIRSEMGEHKRAMADLEAAAATFREVRNEFPSMPEYAERLLMTFINMGTVGRRAGEIVWGTKALAEALPIAQKIADAYPDKPAYRERLADIQLNAATNLTELDHWAEAEGPLRDAIRIYGELVKRLGPQTEFRWRTAQARVLLGHVLVHLNRLADAGPEYEAAIAEFTRLVAGDPGNRVYAFELARVRYRRATLMGKQGQAAEAVAEMTAVATALVPLTEAADTRREARGLLAALRVQQAELLSGAGRHGEAAAALEQAAEFASPDQRLTVASYRAVATVRAGRLFEGLAAAERVMAEPGTDVSAMFLVARAYARAYELPATGWLGRAVRDACGERATDLLRRTHQTLGFTGGALDLLKSDPDLKPLHDRADFQRLVQECEAADAKRWSWRPW